MNNKAQFLSQSLSIWQQTASPFPKTTSQRVYKDVKVLSSFDVHFWGVLKKTIFIHIYTHLDRFLILYYHRHRRLCYNCFSCYVFMCACGNEEGERGNGSVSPNTDGSLGDGKEVVSTSVSTTQRLLERKYLSLFFTVVFLHLIYLLILASRTVAEC